ncbi:MAG: right-handed parallel beta-helix repeat-containing protein, partial [Candidatus Heimdallarchaeota archaeon]|nr:right-handed parallel beta-helix repeat-containing protein [Candidatus Heimdallarchaeota archaeon]MCK5143974.1 right-handed parallel beta-helix repeat-containing protein [Candidatus Heimdallarchaeota archaeon]
MKYQKRLLVVLCFCLILMRSQIIEITTATTDSENLNSNSYIISTPIVIQSDSNISLYSLPGNGTDEDPYRIENLNITTSEEACISIFNTTKHFLIQNCFLNGLLYSILIEETAAHTIQIFNNICQDFHNTGIRVYYTEGAQIINNTCNTGTMYGIRARSSPYISIINNTCTQSNEGGIFLNYCNFSYIYGNNLTNNYKGGMLLDDSFYAKIIANILKNNSFQGGIRLSKSQSALVENNTCIDNVQFNIRLSRSNDSVVRDNYCYGKGTGLSVVMGGNVTILNNDISTEMYGLFIKDSEYSEITENRLIECDYCFYELNPEDYHTYIVENNLVNGKEFGYFTNQQNLEITEPIYGQMLLSNCSGFIIKNQI